MRTKQFRLSSIALAILSTTTLYAGNVFESNGSLKKIGAIQNTDPGIFKLQQALPGIKIEGNSAIAMQRFSWGPQEDLYAALTKFASQNAVDVIYDGSRNALVIQPEGLIKPQPQINTNKVTDHKITPSEVSDVKNKQQEEKGILSSVGKGLDSAVTSVGSFLSSINPFKSEADPQVKEAELKIVKQETNSSVESTPKMEEASPFISQSQRFKSAEATVENSKNEQAKPVQKTEVIKSIASIREPQVITSVATPNVITPEKEPAKYSGVGTGVTLNQVLEAKKIVDPNTEEKLSNEIKLESIRLEKARLYQRSIEDRSRSHQAIDEQRIEDAQARSKKAAELSKSGNPQFSMQLGQNRQNIQKPNESSVSTSNTNIQTGSVIWQVSPGLLSVVVEKIATRHNLSPVYLGPSDAYLDRAITLNGVNAQKDVQDALVATSLSAVSAQIKGAYLVVGDLESVTNFSPDLGYVIEPSRKQTEILVEPAKEKGILSLLSFKGFNLFGSKTEPELNRMTEEELIFASKLLAQGGDWNLQLKHGDSLEYELRDLLLDNGWTMEWIVAKDLKSKGVQRFEGTTITEFLGSFLPKLGLDANVYVKDKHVEIKRLVNR